MFCEFLVLCQVKQVIQLHDCAEYHQLLCSVYLHQLTRGVDNDMNRDSADAKGLQLGTAPELIAEHAYLAAEEAARREPAGCVSIETLTLRARALVAMFIHKPDSAGGSWSGSAACSPRGTEKEIQRALVDLEQVIQMDPENPQLWCERGKVYTSCSDCYCSSSDCGFNSHWCACS